MVAGVPMMNGSETVEGFVPTRDATVVTRLLAAGATITGKAVCEDLCFSGGSHTSRTGPVRNPWDLARSAGGSSSGSAALVAAGEVDLALGGDQGGSVRIPSAYSGTVGHKPTYGLVPYTGAFPIELTIDHLGPITRTVADAALDARRARRGRRPRPPPAHRCPGRRLRGRPRRLRPTGCGSGSSPRVSASPTCREPGVDDAVRAAIEHAARRRMRRRRGLGAVAPRRDARLERDRHRGRHGPDGRRQRLRHELRGPLRPGADRVLRAPVARAGAAVLRDGQAGRAWPGDTPSTPATASTTRWPATWRIELRQAYDDALADHDVLVMPTLPLTAHDDPRPRTRRARSTSPGRWR